jgi:tryptophan synthase alpha subunit
VKNVSDGAIVGSAIIKKIKENIKHKALVKNVGNFIGKINV